MFSFCLLNPTFYFLVFSPSHACCVFRHLEEVLVPGCAASSGMVKAGSVVVDYVPHICWLRQPLGEGTR